MLATRCSSQFFDSLAEAPSMPQTTVRTSATAKTRTMRSEPQRKFSTHAMDMAAVSVRPA